MPKIMIYVFIDESGDIGNPEKPESSKDFSMAACICTSEHLDNMSEQVAKFAENLRMKELKFSKMSAAEKRSVASFLKKSGIYHVSACATKKYFYHGTELLRVIFKDLVQTIEIDSSQKVKFFIDGTENSLLRKVYEPIIRERFPGAMLRFANSIKRPMIQVADFYAGQARKSKK